MYNRILVMGAGAVGGYFGGRLAERTSVSVSLIARGNHLQALQENGLRIVSIDGESVVRVDAFRDPREAEEPDLILFTVKSYDTEAAIRQIEPVVTENTQILTIQNGIENYAKLVKAFGEDRVIQGFCKIGVALPEPGVVEHSAFGIITAGEQDGKSSARLEALSELLSTAGIRFRISPDIHHQAWTKFAWNAVFNMLTAAADVTVEKLFEHSTSEQLCYALFDEIQAVARTQEVILTREDEQKIIDRARKLTGFETSTYQDRQKGKRLEYEAFTGAVVRLADQHGISIPHNRMLYALLKLIDQNEVHHQPTNLQ